MADGLSRRPAGARAGTRSVALRAIKTLAAVGDRLRPPGRGVVVLIYHRVGGGSGTEVDLAPADFDAQMAWLAASGRAMTLDDALALLSGPPAGVRPPSATGTGSATDPVVVTFDDGTADLADVATPILVRHGVPATVYLATRFVDEGIAFPDDGTALSWAAVREMASTGLVSFGSHTHGHLLLDRLAVAAAADELDRSRQLIEAQLGAPAHHFAYPKAVAPSAEVEGLVRARFRSAALAGNRPNPYGATDPHRLARTAVQVSDGMAYFLRKVRGGMGLEDTFRRAVNRVRYRAAVG
jgi:peptidoglycan/xylan/chitin deacetylase (PgdA/CDA1 family)